MNGEDPIAPDEFVLRRIHRNNVNLSAESIVKRCEFEPKPRDIDGLSFYRERYTSAETLLAAARSPDDCYVARIPVNSLTALGLTLRPTPGDLPGHVSMPEVTYATFRADQLSSKKRQLELAVLASRHIVRRPPDD